MNPPVVFALKFVPGGTGLGVWDHPSVGDVVHRFMPQDRRHGPMLGIVSFDNVQPTPNVIKGVMEIGEDVRAGKYGEFSLVVSSKDEATRDVIGGIAKAHDIAIFVTTSASDLQSAEPVGALTEKDKMTLDLVLRLGGTVTATELATNVGVEQTTAGNRLVSLHKKGYLQRVARPHPVGDLFVDPRSVRLESPEKAAVSK